MTEQEDAEPTSLHKHIKNISTFGVTVIENQLGTDRKVF